MSRLLVAALAIADPPDHRFLFVVGPHHSGTTLLAQVLGEHAAVSGLSSTGKPMNEGQHLQSEYPTAVQLGGMTKYAFRDEAHKTELSGLCGGGVRRRLMAAWGPYWNLSRPVLLEKSPNHMLMMRMLRCVFSPERTQFVLTVRHPLGATAFSWRMGKGQLRARRDCGAAYVEHWLRQMETVAADMQHLGGAVHIVQYENFTAGDVAGHVRRLVERLGLGAAGMPPIAIESQPARRYSLQHQMAVYLRRMAAKGDERRRRMGGRGGRPRRQPLGYHGALDVGVVVRPSPEWMPWRDNWAELSAQAEPGTCAAMAAKFGARVAQFGYSLEGDMGRVAPPAALGCAAPGGGGCVPLPR